jgi:hypothetical protein
MVLRAAAAAAAATLRRMAIVTWAAFAVPAVARDLTAALATAATALEIEGVPPTQSPATAGDEDAIPQRAAAFADIGGAAASVAIEVTGVAGGGSYPRTAAVVAASRTARRSADEYGETFSWNDWKFRKHATTAPAMLAAWRGFAAGGSARIDDN